MRAGACLFAALALLASGAFAQSAPPDDLTEPPVPRAAPIRPVVEETLPRVGGVILFGADGGTGLEIVRQLVEKGERVTVMARGTAAAAARGLGAAVIEGDVSESGDIVQAVTSGPFRIVVSALDDAAAFEAVRDIVDVAKATDIPRMLLVSAIGAGDSRDAPPWYVTPFTPDSDVVTAAEEYLRASGLAYTIVRPGLLLDRAASRQAVLVSDAGRFSWIARADLARLVVDALKANDAVNKVLAAYDASRDQIWEVLF